MSREGRVWLTWETQRRNRELARAFGAEYARFDYSARVAPLRYLVSGWKTIATLARGRYRTVFAQCPSIVLCLLVATVKPWFRFTLVLDVHNGVLDWAAGSGVGRRVVRYCFRRADLVIVSNENLSSRVRDLGGVPRVLPDRIPDIESRPRPADWPASGDAVITFVSTFADDEPLETFLAGASRVEAPFRLLITGRRSRAGDLLRYESETVHFTDFLSEPDFEALIQHSDLIVDLTTRDDCLVCGAYEAVSVGVPALVSDSEVNRQTFQEGCLYADDDPDAYRAALERFFAQRSRLAAEMSDYASRFEAGWRERFRKLEGELS